MTIKNETQPPPAPEPEAELEELPEIPKIPEEVRRRALEALPRLRAHREAILAERGGKPIDIEAALREARAAHARGE